MQQITNKEAVSPPGTLCLSVSVDNTLLFSSAVQQFSIPCRKTNYKVKDLPMLFAGNGISCRRWSIIH
jgi:hypothetical protein